MESTRARELFLLIVNINACTKRVLTINKDAKSQSNIFSILSLDTKHSLFWLEKYQSKQAKEKEKPYH